MTMMGKRNSNKYVNNNHPCYFLFVDKKGKWYVTQNVTRLLDSFSLIDLFCGNHVDKLHDYSRCTKCMSKEQIPLCKPSSPKKERHTWWPYKLQQYKQWLLCVVRQSQWIWTILSRKDISPLCRDILASSRVWMSSASIKLLIIFQCIYY